MKLVQNYYNANTFYFLIVADSINGLQQQQQQQQLRGNLVTPQTYTPVDGDLHVQFHYPNPDLVPAPDDTTSPAARQFHDVRLQITRIDGFNRSSNGYVDVYPDPRLNATQITVPCQHFLLGGIYELEIVRNEVNDDDGGNAAVPTAPDERLRQQLDVRWPIPKLSVTPESIGTYPQQPVDVILEFPGVECVASHTQTIGVPEFWVELFYCGHEVFCDITNVTGALILFKEQVRGYPKAHLIKLSCELFGLAGHYVIKLRPVAPVSAQVMATAYVKVCPNAR